MSPRRKLYSFWIDPDHLKALKTIHTRDGILPSEQIRRALAAWIDRKGVKVRGAAARKSRSGK